MLPAAVERAAEARDPSRSEVGHRQCGRRGRHLPGPALRIEHPCQELPVQRAERSIEVIHHPLRMADGSDTRRLEHMSDLSLEERLAKNAAVLEWMEWQVSQQRAKVRTLEAEVEQEKRRRERARIEMSWKLQPPRAEDARPILHRGGCGLYRNQLGYIDRTEAIIALTDDELKVECCEICKPETGLDLPS